VNIPLGCQVSPVTPSPGASAAVSAIRSDFKHFTSNRNGPTAMTTAAAKPLVSVRVDTSHVDCISDPVERYYSYGAVRRDVLHKLSLIAEPTRRAELYQQLADVVEAQAAIYRHVERNPAVCRAGLAELKTTVRLLRHVGHAEAARSRGHRVPLTRDLGRQEWPELEASAAWLLNEIASTPHLRAFSRLYEALAELLVDHRVIATGDADVLLALAETHRQVVAA
jgi:hypothetical protein